MTLDQLVFHIQDPNEREFAFRTPVVLKDMETGREMTVDPRVLREQYQKDFDKFFAAKTKSLLGKS